MQLKYIIFVMSNNVRTRVFNTKTKCDIMKYPKVFTFIKTGDSIV